MTTTSYSVPGVYRRAQPRVTSFPGLRTDVAGFVGVAGAAHLGEAVQVDDWRSYQQTFLRDARGDAISAPAGAQLSACVKAFFGNGGARCWVVNVAPTLDAVAPQVLLNRMLGLAETDPPGQRHGLELLLLQHEVSIVGLPELDALIQTQTQRAEQQPALMPTCFTVSCQPEPEIPEAQRPPLRSGTARLFDDDSVLAGQRYLLSRLQRERWRWFAVLAPPAGAGAQQALDWRRRLTDNLGDCDCAALYWPRVLVSGPGDAAQPHSPVGYVAGVMARRDLRRGPHVAPANESLTGVVGLEHPVDDPLNGELYDAGLNVLRAFPGHGVQVWGARTLLWSSRDSRRNALAYVNGRRCLSAIERRAEQIGQMAVFEPNRPLVRAQLAQAMVGYLLEIFEGGALMGETPEQAFFVRCDSSNNPPEAVEQGQLLCEIGVALAAPAEFIVFRLGRDRGLTEVPEVS